jgi:hypothetical protein
MQNKILKQLFIIFVFLTSSIVYSQELVGVCLFVKGNAFVKNEKTKLELKKGMKIYPGNSILLDHGSLSIIKFPMQTMKILENTEISVDSLKTDDSKFKLTIGGIIVEQTKQKLKNLNNDSALKIKTPSASLGVRGTTFFAFAGTKKQTVMSVENGSVYFKGKSSDREVPVELNTSIMTNESDKNIRPRSFGFENDINFNLDPVKDVEVKASLFSRLEKEWQTYAKEEEYRWEEYKKNDESVWNEWKKSN